MNKYDKGWRQIHMYPIQLGFFDRWHIAFLKVIIHLMEFERLVGRGSMNPVYLAMLSVDIDNLRLSVFRLESGLN